tara:strand:+ start:111 stop:647 length:537 start_codon:yes stop_codon:yes gene_type:complete
MSYKSEDNGLVVAGSKALSHVTLPPRMRNDPSTLYWVKKGAIFPGFMVEQGLIAKSGGLLKPNTNPNRSEDFDDYSDAKYLSVAYQDWYNNPKRYSARLVWEGLKNKKGAIRLVAYERKQNRLYYFYFPRRFWKQWKNVEIPFEVNGDPKDYNKIWAYEVDSFKELARIKKEDWINVR